MARGSSFNSEVAARTLAASKLLNTAELLTQFEAAGGLRSDLEAIVAHGKEAEAFHQSQGILTKAKSNSAVSVQDAFLAVQREYAAIMDVVASLNAELVKAGDKASIATIKKIQENETEVAFNTEALADGSKKRKGRRERTQAATRAEISRDANELLNLKAIAPRLAARRVDEARLLKLKADADALAGLVADRVATATERKLATAREQEAVRNQYLHWQSMSRIAKSVAKREIGMLDIIRLVKQ